MNSDIIPQGPTETIVDGTVTREALLVYAETDLVITDLLYQFQADPPHANAVDAFTLAAGRYLPGVKSLTFTGTATIIYRA